MKTKIILLALAIMSSTLVFSQQVNHESKTDCEKKVLKKIKQTMNYLHVKDYLAEGERNSVVVTCFVNDRNEVEIAKINGSNQELIKGIYETLEERPVKCEQDPEGNYFTFRLTFKHWPA
jgi:hypothetical protein